MDIPETLIFHYILYTCIRIIMLCSINVCNYCMSIKNKNKLIGHNAFPYKTPICPETKEND